MERSLLVRFVIPVALATAMAGEADAAAADSVNLGFGGIIRTMHDCDANVYFAEYEHSLTPNSTILGRIDKVGYKFDDGNYREDGTLRGIDLGARYYPSGDLHGFFAGGSLGYWNGDWMFFHALDRPGQNQGTARTHAVRLNFDIGDRIPIPGTTVSIVPQMNIGKFFSSRSCQYVSPASMVGSACTQKSEVNVYLFVGVAVGTAF